MYTCRICNEQFVPTQKHPGYINVCGEPECRTAAQEKQTPLLTACVSWKDKTMEIVIVDDPKVSERHNKARERQGMLHLSAGGM